MHPEIDRYAHLHSWVHRWSPALKLVGFGVYIVGLALVTSLGAALAGLLISAGFVAASRIPLPFVLLRLRWVVLFMAPFLVLLPLQIRPDVPAGALLGWSPAAERRALILVIRALAIVLVTFPMWGTSPFHVSMKALQELAVPRPLVQMILFSYRYLFVYLDQMRKMHVAMVARGLRPGPTGRSLRAYAHQVGMLLVTSYDQTERILDAMRSRGFQGEIKTLEQPKAARADWIKLVAMAALTLALLTVDRRWLL